MRGASMAEQLQTASGLQFDDRRRNQVCKSCVLARYAMCGYIKLERDGAGDAGRPNQ